MRNAATQFNGGRRMATPTPTPTPRVNVKGPRKKKVSDASDVPFLKAFSSTRHTASLTWVRRRGVIGHRVKPKWALFANYFDVACDPITITFTAGAFPCHSPPSRTLSSHQRSFYLLRGPYSHVRGRQAYLSSSSKESKPEIFATP